VSKAFKQCTMCNQKWQDRDSFLKDEELELNGYSADFEKLENGLFYFTHIIPDCRSTLALRAKVFIDLYKGIKFSESKIGSKECPGFCLERETLARCPAFCEFAFVREIIQIILKSYKGKNENSEVHKSKDGVYKVIPIK